MAGVAAIVAPARVLLLDFDGPVCSVFSGLPGGVVAGELRRVLAGAGVAVPESLRAERDALQILRYAGTLGRPELVCRVEDALCAAELLAVGSARPTPHADEVVVAAHRSGRRVAIASNNSGTAVAGYLTARKLTGYVHPVVGRAYADPARLKPHPASINAVLRELDVPPRACVLIGDSVSDVEAGRAAGIAVVGYANRAGKRQPLAGADVVVDSMAELLPALSVAGAAEAR